MEALDEDLPQFSYYKKLGTWPGAQASFDLRQHTARRTALYRQLGITLNNIRGRRIIDFGSGPGDNAIHLASLEPSNMVLVDANEGSLAVLKERREHGLFGPHCEISDAKILDFTGDARFDLVICEGVIPGNPRPGKFLSHVAGFADVGGIVVTTTTSPESYLSEICRRALVPLLVRGEQDLLESLDQLTNFFSTDLNSLVGMTRRHQDWVLDNILHPWTRHGVFAAEDAIAALGETFSVLGSAPHFVQDWRWYKTIAEDHSIRAREAINEWRRWAPYLLDYRIQPQRPLPEIAERLCDLAQQCLTAHDTIQQGARLSDYDGLIGGLSDIEWLIRRALPPTAESIRDYLSGLRALAGGQPDPDFGSFRQWFGRGQQHLSFVLD